METNNRKLGLKVTFSERLGRFETPHGFEMLLCSIQIYTMLFGSFLFLGGKINGLL